MLKRSGFREIPHTADREIEAWATNFEGLIIECAKGMVALMELKPTNESLSKRSIQIPEDDKEVMLVGYLNNLLYLIEIEHLIPVTFAINKSPGGLIAQMQMSPFHKGGTEIKAITFHKMKITEVNGGWRTHVVFDV